MFQITHSNFQAEDLVRWITTHKEAHMSDEENFWTNASSFHWKFGPEVRFLFNGNDVTQSFAYQAGVDGFTILIQLNNSLCKLLTEDSSHEKNVVFPMKIIGTTLSFISIPYGEFEKIIPNESFDLAQVIEECTRVIREIKNECWKASQKLYPKNPAFFLHAMLGKEALFTASLFDTESFNWIAEMNESHRHANRHYSTLISWDASKDPPPDEWGNTDVFILNTAYSILPLEEAWDSYKKSNFSSSL